MGKIAKKPKEDHSNDWLSTYGDMVTLLLTFFVLLYATSSTDEQKWQYIFQAFQSRGKYLNMYVDSPNPDKDKGDGTTNIEPDNQTGTYQGILPQTFDQLYQYISKYVTENNLEQSISLEDGVSHLSIRFDDSVFFEPNSAILTQAGRDLIAGISPGITAVKSSIKKCTVSGHTAKAISEINDWDLSSARAVSVVKFMDFRGVLDTEQFRTQGCGYADPVADNDTPEGRAKNRRVEMVLLKKDIDPTDPEVIKDIMKYDYGIDMDKFDPDGDRETNTSKVPSDFAQSIIASLDEKYPNRGGGSTAGTIIGPAVPGDYSSFSVSVEAAAEDNDVAEDENSDAGGENSEG